MKKENFVYVSPAQISFTKTLRTINYVFSKINTFVTK